MGCYGLDYPRPHTVSPGAGSKRIIMSLIGAHVSIAGGLWKAIERGESLGCEAIQIFTKNQLQWRASPISESVGSRFMAAWSRSAIKKVVAHASYLLNLASGKE